MLLKSKTFVDTNNLESARDWIMSKFGASRFEVSTHDRRLNITSSYYGFNAISILRSHSNSSVETEFPAANFFRQYFVLRGSGRIGVDAKSELEISRRVSAVVDPGRPITVWTGVDLEHLILRIDENALKRKLGAVLGKQIDEAPLFGQAVDPESPMMQSMAQAIRLFISDADSFAAHDSDLVREEFEQAIIARFLFCHSHSYTSILLGPSPKLSFPQLRLIEDYIEANWDKPLDIEMLAKIFDLSARSIFRHFRRVRNCTPLEFSKGIRLKQARRRLQSGDNKLSVMRVALACGFQSLGHFAREYHTTFGELPSQTLHGTRSDWTELWLLISPSPRSSPRCRLATA